MHIARVTPSVDDGLTPASDRRPDRWVGRASAQDSDRRMTQPPSDSCSEGQATLAPAVEELLIDVVADGFTVYCCGDRATPSALVATYEWDHWIDLITIRDFERVTAARMPKRGRVDLFAPQAVVWAYEGTAEQALLMLLNLVHPACPDAPTAEFPAPPRLQVPRAEQRPMTIRLPPHCRAGVRATRLARHLHVDLQ